MEDAKSKRGKNLIQVFVKPPNDKNRRGIKERHVLDFFYSLPLCQLFSRKISGRKCLNQFPFLLLLPDGISTNELLQCGRRRKRREDFRRLEKKNGARWRQEVNRKTAENVSNMCHVNKISGTLFFFVTFKHLFTTKRVPAKEQKQRGGALLTVQLVW